MAHFSYWNDPGIEDVTLKFTWGVNYASAVHEGDPHTGRPARPWTDDVIAKNDIEGIFVDCFEESGYEIHQAWEMFASKMNTLFREQIESPVYDWYGTTVRRSGEIVDSPRNIVDLGNLRDSQRWELYP